MLGTPWRGIAALVGSALAHALILALATPLVGRVPSELTASFGITVEEPVAVAVVPSEEIARLSPLVPAPPGEPIPRVPGPADVTSREESAPNPNADVDVPDRAPAVHGGGGEGGPDTWTGRHDGEVLRAQAWNDPDRYQLPRRRSGPVRASDESIVQDPRPGLGQQEERAAKRARVGETQASVPPARGADQLDPRWDEGGAGPGDPASPARTVTRLTEEGSVVVRVERPLVEDGPAATEAQRRGRTRDDVDAAQASNERRPDPLELTRPRARGKAGEDVAGARPGRGLSARSRRERGGDGGLRADLAQADAGVAATQARQQDAYFRRLNARVLDRVAFPSHLAVSLEQGQVVVSFTLFPDGTVAEVRVSRSSGYEDFDRAVVTAVRAAAPFGRVPDAIRQGRDWIKVNAPFEFDNPLIR